MAVRVMNALAARWAAMTAQDQIAMAHRRVALLLMGG